MQPLAATSAVKKQFFKCGIGVSADFGHRVTYRRDVRRYFIDDSPYELADVSARCSQSVVRIKGQAQRLQIDLCRVAHGYRVGIRIVPIGTGENRESIDQILDKAGEWPLYFDVAEYAQLICWEFAGIGQQATGWFERGDTTVVRWFADTAAAVRADAEGRAARRDNGRLTATATAGRALQVVRIIGAAVESIIGLIRHRKIGDVADPDNDRPGSPQPRNDGCVFRRHAIHGT